VGGGNRSNAEGGDGGPAEANRAGKPNVKGVSREIEWEGTEKRGAGGKDLGGKLEKTAEEGGRKEHEVEAKRQKARRSFSEHWSRIKRTVNKQSHKRGRGDLQL